MKIRLLKNTGYGGLGRVQFPVEVVGHKDSAGSFYVFGEDLISVGADEDSFMRGYRYYWIGTKVEVIS